MHSQFLFGDFLRVRVVEQALCRGERLAVFSDPFTALARLGLKLQSRAEEVGKQAEFIGIQIVHQLDHADIAHSVIAEQLAYARPVFLLDMGVVVGVIRA